MTTAVYYDDLFLRHDTGRHPERPERLTAIVEHLRKTGLWDNLVHPEAPDATVEDVARVHELRYVEYALDLAEKGGGSLDADTVVSPDSGAAALRAVGSAQAACDAVLDGAYDSAVCLVRPPGHHARPRVGMGFCLFNNVAIAARRLLDERGVGRVAILDWDAHHGNGTQEAFWREPRAFYLSTHLWPFYPGTGAREEVGEGPGEGSTLNLPVERGASSEDVATAFADAVAGPVADFRPDFILISAGFDGYARDPLAGMGLEPEDFRSMTDAAMDLANACCSGRVVSCLEGGYDLDGLARCVAAHLEGMAGGPGGEEMSDRY